MEREGGRRGGGGLRQTAVKTWGFRESGRRTASGQRERESPTERTDDVGDDDDGGVRVSESSVQLMAPLRET